MKKTFFFQGMLNQKHPLLVLKGKAAELQSKSQSEKFKYLNFYQFILNEVCWPL